MRTIKFTIIFLMICLGVSIQVQAGSGSVLLKRSNVMFCPPSKVLDAKTGKQAIVWPPEYKGWKNDVRWIDDVPTVSEEFMFSNFPMLEAMGEIEPAIPVCWLLANEGDHTVLHCYLKMPADEITNVGIASDETTILDIETGTIYPALATVPDVYGKRMGIRGKKGEYVDIKIIYPRLPDHVRSVSLYGVQNWQLEGGMVYDLVRDISSQPGYDSRPVFHVPTMISPEKNYDQNKTETWAVYSNPHLVKPLFYGTDEAVWLTPEATYVALGFEQNWVKEYWGFSKSTVLIDQSNNQYKLLEIEGMPAGRQFYIKGYPGDYVAFLFKFEPMPLNTTTFTFMAPASETPILVDGADNGPCIRSGRDVAKLRANQHRFDYHERKVVK